MFLAPKGLGGCNSAAIQQSLVLSSPGLVRMSGLSVFRLQGQFSLKMSVAQTYYLNKMMKKLNYHSIPKPIRLICDVSLIDRCTLSWQR